MANRQNINGYSFSWNQPYGSSQWGEAWGRISSAADEMARLEMVDRWVDSMLTFPDAEVIINKIRKEIQHD